MSVKLVQKRYVVEFRLKGRRIFRRLPQGTTRREAQELETRIRSAIFSEVTLGRKPEIQIAAAIQAWLSEVVTGRKAEKETRRHARALADWIIGQALEELPEVAREYAKRQAGTLANATINRRLCILKATAKFAYQKGWIETNLSPRIQTKPENNKRDRYLSKEEITALVANCSEPSGKAWIMIAVYTGMRQGEIMKLTQANIKDGLIRITDSKNGTPRNIPLLALLEPYVKFLPFPLHSRTYYKMFEEARDKAGLTGLTFHDLRHTTASLLISNGVDIYTVGEILGHKSVQTTKRYAHLSVEHLKKAMEKLG